MRTQKAKEYKQHNFSFCKNEHCITLDILDGFCHLLGYYTIFLLTKQVNFYLNLQTTMHVNRGNTASSSLLQYYSGVQITCVMYDNDK